MKEKPTGSGSVVLRDRSKASLSCSLEWIRRDFCSFLALILPIESGALCAPGQHYFCVSFLVLFLP